MGGFKGVALALGAVLTRIFSKDIAAGITNLQYSIMGLTKSGRAQLEEIKTALPDLVYNNPSRKFMQKERFDI
jgi:hypothetical protein